MVRKKKKPIEIKSDEAEEKRKLRIYKKKHPEEDFEEVDDDEADEPLSLVDKKAPPKETIKYDDIEEMETR